MSVTANVIDDKDGVHANLRFLALPRIGDTIILAVVNDAGEKQRSHREVYDVVHDPPQDAWEPIEVDIYTRAKK